jgi:hypothetical protein
LTQARILSKHEKWLSFLANASDSGFFIHYSFCPLHSS